MSTNYAATEAWHKWFTSHYDKLLAKARKYHVDAHDLVHHTYLRVDRQPHDKIMRNPWAYFNRAMWIEATRGEYAKQYKYRSQHIPEQQAVTDLEDVIMRESLHLIIDRLHWFDRCVMMLYLEGYNMSDVARESGIKVSTLHVSLYRTRQKLKNVFS